jgi:type I restriction enzyme, S subunit
MSPLPHKWKFVRLSQLGRWIGGGTPSKANPSFWVTEGIPWVSPKDMKKLYLDDAQDHITNTAVEQSSTNVVAEGSVLVVTRSGILSHTLPVAKALRPLAINQDMKALIPHKEVNADYVLHALRAMEPRILQECSKSGTTVANLDTDRLLNFQIPLPPLQVQRCVVAKLESLFRRSKSAHEELTRIPRLVERYKQSILAAAFRGDLTAEWRKEQGLAGPKSATVDTLVSVPIRNGLSVRGSDIPPGVRSLRLSALRSGVVDLNDVRFLPITGNEAERFLLRDGDVLVSRGNGTKSFVGIAALVHNIDDPTIFPDTAFRIRLATDRARPEWFTSMWNAPQVRTQVEGAAKTTAGIWKVSQADLARIELSLPDPKEQEEIARRIKSAFAHIEKTAMEAARATRLLDRLDQATLAKAFQGELISSDPGLSC